MFCLLTDSNICNSDDASRNPSTGSCVRPPSSDRKKTCIHLYSLLLFFALILNIQLSEAFKSPKAADFGNLDTGNMGFFAQLKHNIDSNNRLQYILFISLSIFMC